MRTLRFLLFALVPSLTLPTAAAAQAPRFLVTTDWVAAHANDEGISILHVGADRRNYDSGHLPGARFVAMADIVVSHEGTPNELPPAAHLTQVLEKLGVADAGTIVIYGDDKGLQAARLFFTLDYLGHGDRAALLDGGLDKWRRERRTLSTESEAAPRRPFTPRIDPDVLVTLPVVRDVSWAVTEARDPTWLLIDARPDAQFTGADPGEGVSRPGHIPGATGIFWQRALVSAENPVVRPVPELRRLLEDAGAKTGTRIITYCRTGVQSSFAYFVARYLGYNTKMYDGSFIEWSRASDTAVER
jgi:thiosulfate/3-mercaptopyruvate sulfurtransferase